jgi:hypothetical protein
MQLLFAFPLCLADDCRQMKSVVLGGGKRSLWKQSFFPSHTEAFFQFGNGIDLTEIYFKKVVIIVIVNV